MATGPQRFLVDNSFLAQQSPRANGSSSDRYEPIVPNEWFHPLTDIAVRSPAIGQLWAALPLFPGWRQESGALKWKSVDL